MASHDPFQSAIDRVATRMPGGALSDEALGRQVEALSHTYTRQRDSIEGASVTPGALQARLRFFLPRDSPKVFGPLDELRFAKLLVVDRPWRILDVGAGLGAMTFGALRFGYARCAVSGAEVTAFDRAASTLRIMEDLAKTWEDEGGPAIDLHTTVGDVRRSGVLPDGAYDLIVVGFALNEFAGASSPQDTALWLERLCRSLRPGGSCIVIEPALKKTSRFLHAVRDQFVHERWDGATQPFAPCLHRAPCPMLTTERDWCHEQWDQPLPAPVAELARAAGLRDQRLTYSYLTLRNDGASLRGALQTDREPYRVVSEPIATKGKVELFVCGSGHRPRLRRMNRDATSKNAGMNAVRGDLLGLGRKVDQAARVGPDLVVELLRRHDNGTITDT